MADNLELQILIKASVTDAIKELKGLDNASESSSRSAKKLEENWKQFGDAIKGGLGIGAGLSAFNLLERGVSKTVDVFKESIDQALEAEQSQKKLAQALRASGDESAQSLASFTEYAGIIQQTTKFTDDQASAFIALAANLGAPKDRIKEIVDTALDLNAAVGVDASAAIEALTLAVNGNYRAIGGIIPQYKGLTEEQLKNRDVLSELSQRYSSFAENDINGAGGSLTQLGKAFGEVQESIGTVIIESDVFKGSIGALTEVLLDVNNKLNDKSKANEDVRKELLNTNLTLDESVAFFGKYGLAVKGAYEVLSALAPGAKLAALSLGNLIGVVDDLTVNDAVSKSMGKPLVEAKVQLKEIDDLFKGIASGSLSPIKDQIENIATTATSSKETVALNLSEIQLLKQASAEEDLLRKQNEALENQVFFEDEYIRLAEGLGTQEALKAISRAKELEEEGKHKEALRLLNEKYQAADLASKKKQDDAQAALDKKAKDKERDNIFAIQDYNALSNRERLANMQSTLGTISTLQKSSNKELFAVGKAAAVSTAIIDGFAAVQKALASAPPPFNFALAALVGVATAANVSSIASQKAPSFEQGGIVPGTSFTGDKVGVNVNSGELILNRAQQDNLVGQLNQPQRQGDIIIQIDGREIARAVKNQIDAGYRMAV